MVFHWIWILWHPVVVVAANKLPDTSWLHQSTTMVPDWSLRRTWFRWEGRLEVDFSSVVVLFQKWLPPSMSNNEKSVADPDGNSNNHGGGIPPTDASFKKTWTEVSDDGRMQDLCVRAFPRIVIVC